MTTMAPSPKRMADYFFMVGLHDDFSLLDDSFADHPEVNSPTEHTDTYPSQHTATTQADRSPPTHSSNFNGDTTHSVVTSHSGSIPPELPPRSMVDSTSNPPQGQMSTRRSHTRTRSKSVAQFNHTGLPLSDLVHNTQESPVSTQKSTYLSIVGLECCPFFPSNLKAFRTFFCLFVYVLLC